MNPIKQQSFLKPFLTVEEQIEQLKSRGMKFHNEEKAKKYLENLNYYRLGGYWLIFEENHEKHEFYEDTYFEEVVNLYLFDRDLKLLLLDAIERVEVSIRSKLAYHLAQNFGSHAHLKAEIFSSSINYSKTLIKLKSELDRNRNEIFIKHHFEKYSEELPPIWVSVEVMTIGQISNWYSNIKDRKYRQIIAKSYDLDEKILSSFLHHLTIIRNISAHHSRLWNKKFTIDFILPNFPKELNDKFNLSSRKYIYNTLIMCEYLLNIIDENNNWKIRLDELIDKYRINTKNMGFK
ncbi:Abi family protein [Aliarcobacter lanthieri]|uniref:Abi family protein n=1 Tax=Aliarcobacter lanthieri TaxID=1355374 RepID=UPI003AAB6868